MLKYSDKYLPVDPDFEQNVLLNVGGAKKGKVHYFDYNGSIGLGEGRIESMEKMPDGCFITMSATDEMIRLDKIITLFGNPGPAYDQYDRYANACLTCEDLGQF
ncbi:MAG: hypothetical protein ABJ004_00610 [Cyclobacteriaceae bacterium]